MSPKPSDAFLQVAVSAEYIDGLYRYAMVLTRDYAQAQDLVQETYVRAIPAIGNLREIQNMKGWLFTILRNLWLNQLRRRRVACGIRDLDLEKRCGHIETTDAGDSHALYVSHVERSQVRDAIRQLPTNFREVILLREYEELSYQEIANLLDCPAGTVMSRLGRARSKLRKLLSGLGPSFETNG